MLCGSLKEIAQNVSCIFVIIGFKKRHTDTTQCHPTRNLQGEAVGGGVGIWVVGNVGVAGVAGGGSISVVGAKVGETVVIKDLDEELSFIAIGIATAMTTTTRRTLILANSITLRRLLFGWLSVVDVVAFVVVVCVGGVCCVVDVSCCCGSENGGGG